MNEKQFGEFMKELGIVKRLLVLNTSKTGATSDEIAKCVGVGGSQIRNILSGSWKTRRGGNA